MSMTSTKQTALYGRLSGSPEFNTDDATHMKELIVRAGDFIRGYCKLPRYPELLQGFSRSAASPSTDLTGEATAVFFISVNGSGWSEIEITLANCGTSADTATELQTQIQAEDDDSAAMAIFGEVTVAYADSLYTITSGRYGADSTINIAFNEDEADVVRALKLSPEYGGVEEVGGALDEELDDACIMLAESLYAKLGLEGIRSGTTAGGQRSGVIFEEHDLDPRVKNILDNRRGAWSG